MRTIFGIFALALTFVVGSPWAQATGCDAPYPSDFFSVTQAEQKSKGAGLGSFEGLYTVFRDGREVARRCARLYLRQVDSGLVLWGWTVGTLVLDGKSYPPLPLPPEGISLLTHHDRWSARLGNGIPFSVEYDSQKDGVQIRIGGMNGYTGEGFLSRVKPLVAQSN